MLKRKTNEDVEVKILLLSDIQVNIIKFINHNIFFLILNFPDSCFTIVSRFEGFDRLNSLGSKLICWLNSFLDSINLLVVFSLLVS